VGGETTGVPRCMSGVCPEQCEWRVRHEATLRVDDEASLGSKTVAGVRLSTRDRLPCSELVHAAR
jgi:hypothetical protein